MPHGSLMKILAASVREALRDGEPERAEHLCKALLRLERERIETLIHRSRALMADNPCTIRDEGYRPREYLVSAIVSTYKAERFMEGRLADLLGQSIGNRLEILVVDSASPEGEGEIVARFQKQSDNIRYLRTAHRETIYQSWNRGIRLAAGRYLTNANTDDRLRQDAMERLTSELEQDNGAAIAYANFLVTETANETFETRTSTTATIRPSYSLNALLENCITGSQPVWRRSLHQTFGDFDIGYASAGDYDFFIRSARQCGAIHIPEPLGLVWSSPETYSGVGSLPGMEFHAIRERYRHLLRPTGRECIPTREREAAWNRILGLLAAERDDEIASRAGDDPLLCCRLGRHYEVIGDDFNAWRYFQRAFYLAPEQPGYREAMDLAFRMNLLDSIQETARLQDAFSRRDHLQTMALALRMARLTNCAAWLYAEALEPEHLSAVSLVNLERVLPQIANGVTGE